MTQLAIRFDGATYDPAEDEERLSTLLGRVYAVMQSGGWWTLEDLQRACGGSEAGLSARIRDLRKQRFGGHVVERKRAGNGLWLYRLKTGGSP